MRLRYGLLDSGIVEVRMPIDDVMVLCWMGMLTCSPSRPFRTEDNLSVTEGACRFGYVTRR